MLHLLHACMCTLFVYCHNSLFPHQLLTRVCALVHSFLAGVDFFELVLSRIHVCAFSTQIVLDKFDDRVLLYDFSSSHVTNKVIVQLCWTNCIPLACIFLSFKYLSPSLHLSLSLPSLATCLYTPPKFICHY